MSDGSAKVERVSHPAHYNKGPIEADGTAKYEAIKIIEDWGLGFCGGNALKYILRAPHKGSEREDLEKARWYLERQSDFPDRDGPECSILSRDVIAAWGLEGPLAAAVDALRYLDFKRALVALNARLLRQGDDK